MFNCLHRERIVSRSKNNILHVLELQHYREGKKLMGFYHFCFSAVLCAILSLPRLD